MLDTLPLAPAQLLIVCAGVAIAYIIFGMAGFGTALVAAPLLALFIPLPMIVPMLALLDFAAASVGVARDRKDADPAEIWRIVPAMAIGSMLGATILLRGNPRVLALGLGLFAIGWAIYTLSGVRPNARFRPRAALPFGLIGGVFSALFGSGGFIYAIYLSGRIEAVERFRVTQSLLIGWLR